MDRVSAAMEWSPGNVFLFGGAEYVLVDPRTEQVRPGYPRSIDADWPGIFPEHLDTAVLWNNGKAYFFKGGQYVRYDVASDKADPGYPRPIAGNWPGVFEDGIDAAILWNNGKAYFFKGDQYIRYDVEADRTDPGYPKSIAGNWPGVFDRNIDDCVNWLPGKVAFFRAGQYVRYDVAADRADAGYPRPVPPHLLGRPSPDVLGAKRPRMLALIDKWMPTSLLNPRIPEGETRDLMATAGWTKATGQNSKKVKDAGGHPTTSCGDVLSAMLRLWGSTFVGAFNIRDTDATGHGPGAKALGYYVTADQIVVEEDGVKSPKPGDIIVLRNGVGPTSAGSVGHVGILVEAGQAKWLTADGGGGQLPDQTATVTARDVRWLNRIPILKSPTDLREKQLDGWLDLDRLEQS